MMQIELLQVLQMPNLPKHLSLKCGKWEKGEENLFLFYTEILWKFSRSFKILAKLNVDRMGRGQFLPIDRMP